MSKLISSFLLMGTLASLANCAAGAVKEPPIDVGDKLVLPADHTYVIPPQGIRFSNGFTIGVNND